MPRDVQQRIIDLGLKLYAINAYDVAKDTGMGGRINTIMQTCFFYLSNILPQDEAIAAIKNAIKKTYGKRGDQVVQMNYAAVDSAVAALHKIEIPEVATSELVKPPTVPAEAPQFVQEITATIMAGRGEDLKVSQIPVDGMWPTDTTQWEKRNIALEIPVWEPEICIQCGKCSFHCPHATIRTKVYEESALAAAPETFKSIKARGKDWAGLKWTIQIAPEDCTGCGCCVEICPGRDKQNPDRKAINMEFQPPLRDSEHDNYEFFESIPYVDRSLVRVSSVKGSQLLEPLFEYSGACAGCGETPYVKLLSQLFGDRLLIGNATGCSSIYGGNLPTTPYAKNSDGRGPTWNNSLFEDAAEFSYGLRLSVDRQEDLARGLTSSMREILGDQLVEQVLTAKQTNEAELAVQRGRVAEMKRILQSAIDNGNGDRRYKSLMVASDYLVKKSVWGVGGDGWAYDIGFGGVDHVLASNRNINLLVLNTQVYSNTGGQCSKATPMGAVALFAAGGKLTGKKDLGTMIRTYGNVYVAQVAMGYSDAQTVRAFTEAESFDGPSLIIAYSHCINMGIDMAKGFEQQKHAVQSGAWFLWRFDPRLAGQGKNPLQIDQREPDRPLSEFVYSENRFNMLKKSHPDIAAKIINRAQNHVWTNWGLLNQHAQMTYDVDCPFETGAVDEASLNVDGVPSGAKEVLGTPSGLNCPVACDIRTSSNRDQRG
jgi:pyruvate-ferredoxin/flavodoxin oxidoreductase